MTTEAFSSRVFELARTLDVLRRALEVDDRALAVLATAQVLVAIAVVERDYLRVATDARPEADRMLLAVRNRAQAVLDVSPTRLDGLPAIRAFLERFGPKH
jgi:hypothetical protein